MAYFTKLDDNIVTEVIAISDEVCGMPTLTFPDTDSAGRAYIANGLQLAGTFAQTSIDGLFRGCYAGIGYTFNPLLGQYGEYLPPTVEPEPTAEDYTTQPEPVIEAP